MSEKLQQVPALRAGTKLIYAGQPGEVIGLMNDGRAIVAHPERAPKIINLDGTEEPFVWNVVE
ncbi:hypothetical protein IVB18_26345 [Bradyrhizobium sp. 186]|uniref:hypothetical protein n=1 Tax=Bradyrhizobium sp. 186 TaxID=2782654 RepID=UPI002000D1D4|nr:hypothetical protein [Bradyrhizobium sp. 186]UPK31850.1 hypothetical protein IVB18_26345 [Bradyrhizobium sp. 186]